MPSMKPLARRSFVRTRLAPVLLLIALAAPAAAQPTPDGPPFVIGADGLATLGEPRVAAGPSGATVALWVGQCPGLAVCVRTWDAAGTAVAGPVGIAVPVAELDAVPALTAVAGGDFWVAWSRPAAVGFAREVVMRRFAASGAPLGIERVVAAEAGQIFAAPALGADAAGALVVAWERRRFEDEVGGQPVAVGVEIRARRFDAAGAAIGDPFRVDVADGELVAAPALAVAPDGRFLVAWESFGFDAAEDDVLARRFTPDGDGGAVAAGPPVQVHPSAAGRQLAPAAAASSAGTFLVAWEGPGGDFRGVFGQVYGDGGPLWVAPFGLGVAVAGQARPAVGGGDVFVVAWEDGREGGSLFAQRRDAVGAPLGGGFRVDAGEGVALAPAVAALPGAGAAGGLFAAWSARLPDFSRRVLGRRYAGTTPPPPPCVETASTLCLGAAGRFRVTASWTTSVGGAGVGFLRPLTEDTGAFWFFDEANLELIVKVLAACPVNGHHWVFAAGLTNVAVTLVVEDTVTGARRTYTNPQGTAFQPIQDTAAFPCP